MNIFRLFGLWKHNILDKNCCTEGTVIAVRTSLLHVVKKPVRLSVRPDNTLYSHYITFLYTVDGVTHKGSLYVDLKYRCPQKGERINVYYDPRNPKNYACQAFGPAAYPIGW